MEQTAEKKKGISVQTKTILLFLCPLLIVAAIYLFYYAVPYHTAPYQDGVYIVNFHGLMANVTVPEKIGGQTVRGIGDNAFMDQAEITRVTVPGCMERIGSAAFANCDKLKEVTFEEGITQIGPFVFSGCETLETVHLPEGLTSIGEKTFRDCPYIREVVIPDSVTWIGELLFEDTTNPGNNNPDAVICAHAGTAAEAYARDNNIKFRALD